MNDERLEELRGKYKNRRLLEELNWGMYATHRGYTSKQNGEFLNWLCDSAYHEIKAKQHSVPMENMDNMIAEINNLTAPKTDTEYQDGFYDCEQMILDIINKYCRGGSR